jgi:hypothetical protein
MEPEVVSIEESEKVDNETDLSGNNKIKNETVTTELHFELLKQYAWLSSVIIGAVVILIQLKVVSFTSDLYIPLFCFGASIFISLLGQDFIVDSLIKGKTIYCISSKIKIYRYISMFSLFVGVGMLAGTITSDLG